MIQFRTKEQLQSHYNALISKKDPNKKTISVSSGSCGQARGSLELIAAFQKAITGHEDKIDMKITGCHGFCTAESSVLILPDQIFYGKLKASDATKIVKSLIKGEIAQDLLLTENNQKFVHMNEIPFYKYQMQILTGNNPYLDPTKFDDYISMGGYQALSKALEMKPEEIIKIIKDSGLRGRGGAGFPTGTKWEMAAKQKSEIKFVICNGDEGDPGAYMDRNLLEGNPQSVIEGMIIGGYAIGATKGWIYVRDEYPLAVKHLIQAIKQLREVGLLGNNILGSSFNFDIEITRGAGAFVCGEETALISSIESKRGIPRQRPPFPAEKGLFGKPTNINNVETWANVPNIIDKGAAWFANIGTKTSKGTKIFSLVGKVKNSGLVEVAMGITLQKIVYDIGGGAMGGKEVKAVQTGGPSGGCIPKNLFNIEVDYDSLTKVGSIMGSGGMIVMDENTCMIDFARYFENFLQKESCGMCSTCREGTQRMFEILTDITEGKAGLEVIDLLQELGSVVKEASFCGLGQTSANPVLSTLRYFKDEYISHIKDKHCAAGVCKALITYYIISENCTSCGLCKLNCPEKAVSGEVKQKHSIDPQKCIRCGICYDGCKFKAITFK
jgi:NADH-quinone oxidoreductase subunit F